MKACLIVDDSRVIRKAVRRMVENLGFVTSEAADGRAALDQCKEQMPDVVLLDWNMPVMDGLDFLIELRKLPDGDQPAVVFCTTENDIQHMQKAFDAGANEYIMKPFNQDIVEAKFNLVGVL